MKKIITAVAVALGTCGLALAAPTSAMAAEVGVEIEHQTTVEGTLPNSDVLQHLHDTNNQIKQDIDTTAQHLDQLHEQAHQDADSLRQHHEQAWQDAQQTHDDIKGAVDGAYDRAHDTQQTLHQDAQDAQQHLD